MKNGEVLEEVGEEVIGHEESCQEVKVEEACQEMEDYTYNANSILIIKIPNLCKSAIVKHPQTNGQVETANKVILKGLKKRLEGKKGSWANELASVLWSYRTSPQSSTGKTPFRLTYAVDAVIPVEVREPSPRLLIGGGSEAVEKDLIDETRQMAHLTETAIKQKIALRYNGKTLKRSLEEGDLVLRHNVIGPPIPGEGKLAANWEGPYKVREVLGKGAYKLERLDGSEVPRTWNMANLKRFYS
ncbi:uncharacterized protein [Arachis hypogaea]|uniref:uncharacterized protein n=1 Tax=Arachis hypogaea TaxID=3818 RepID=UPI003B223402